MFFPLISTEFPFSIKAKTNEGLDETGKGNAVSAIAVVLVEN